MRLHRHTDWWRRYQFRLQTRQVHNHPNGVILAIWQWWWNYFFKWNFDHDLRLTFLITHFNSNVGYSLICQKRNIQYIFCPLSAEMVFCLIHAVFGDPVYICQQLYPISVTICCASYSFCISPLSIWIRAQYIVEKYFGYVKMRPYYKSVTKQLHNTGSLQYTYHITSSMEKDSYEYSSKETYFYISYICVWPSGGIIYLIHVFRANRQMYNVCLTKMIIVTLTYKRP